MHPEIYICRSMYMSKNTQTHLPIMQAAQQCSDRVADLGAHHSIELQSPAVLTVVSVLTVRQVTGQQPKNSSGKRCTDQVSNQCGFHLHTMGQKLLYSYNSPWFAKTLVLRKDWNIMPVKSLDIPTFFIMIIFHIWIVIRSNY